MLMASRWTGIFSSMRVTDSRSATAIVTIRAWRILPGGLRRSSWNENWEPSRLLKKPHMLRCARPTRFNVLKRTPQLIELRAPCL